MSAEGSAVRVNPAPGDLLGGKYALVRVIGEGGMGVVYEAMHQRLGQRVAVKVLREEERRVPELVARFEREARAAAKLKGQNVARVTDVDTMPDGTPFMVMEFLEGHDLDHEIAERGALPIDEAVGYLLQACSAVAEAHSLGIVHRDLKPHNLFLTGEPNARKIKLLDFGISKIAAEAETSVTLTRSSLGTPLYMSPEQIRSAKRADARSDIWSLGVILYELLTGTTPFTGEGPSAVIASITADTAKPPHEVRVGIPLALSDAVMVALVKDPDGRFQTVTQLAEAIRPFGPTGAWTPEPLVASSPSNPRISNPVITDAPTIRASAETEPSFVGPDPSLAAPAQASPTPKRGAGPLLIALGALIPVAGIAGYLLLGRASGPSPTATSEPTSIQAPRPPAKEVEVAPLVPETVATSDPAPEPVPVATKPGRPAKPGAAPGKPGASAAVPPASAKAASPGEPKASTPKPQSPDIPLRL